MKLPVQSPPVVRYTTSNVTTSLLASADTTQTASLRATANSSASGVSTSDACIGVGIVNHRVCLKIPVVGNVCIPVPVGLPNVGAQACVSVCTKWGIPTGACVSVKVQGHQVARQCFGWC